MSKKQENMSAKIDEIRMKWAYYNTYYKIFNLGFPCACNLESVQDSQKMTEKDMKTIDTILMNCTDDLAYLFIFREMNGLNDGKFKDLGEIGHKYGITRKRVADAHNEVLDSARDYATIHVKINSENKEDYKNVLKTYGPKVKRI